MCIFFFLIILPVTPHPHKTMVTWTHQKPAVCQSGNLQEGVVEPPPYAERLLHLREKSGVDTSADLHPCVCLPHSANKRKQKKTQTKLHKSKRKQIRNVLNIIFILQLRYANEGIQII